MEQHIKSPGESRGELRGEMRPEAGQTRRPRRVAVRRSAAAERPSQFVRSDARRGTDMASRVAVPRPAPENGQERLMTFGLRASITAAMLGMSLFFHTQLGAALGSLLR
jgi:hypothetical protein